MGLRHGFCNGESALECRYTDAFHLPRTRRDRGLVTFAKYPKYILSLPRPVILPKGYPSLPQTIGEHIRKKRLDLGLKQKDVAEIIGVTESTIWNWEHGREPEIRHYPKIIEFLGYVPFEIPDNADPLNRLNRFRLLNGFSYKRLSELTGIDETQLSEWIRGIHRPSGRSVLRIERFINTIRT